MPRQRDVKPWTIYPPTQEDREIIERKAAAASLSVSAYLCMVGKLACVTVNIPTEQEVLSEQEPVKKPAYTFQTTWGKRLTPEQVTKVEKALACDDAALVGEADDGSGWKQYVCNEDGFQFELRPVKEV